MKILPLLIGLVLAFVSLTTFVNAYGTYGYNSLPQPYGYRESTDFYGNYNYNNNLNSYTDSSFFKQNGNQFTNLQELYLNSGSAGYSNNYLQNFLQNENTNLNDGYSFTKGPCVSERIEGNFHGKSNDFTITKKVCDNIEGNFFKDNSYTNSLSNGASLNNNQFGVNAYQNQYNNQNTLNNAYTQQQSSSLSQQQQALSVSFGKGTRIVLN